MWTELTQAERDASYNNGAAVPEVHELTAQRVAASKAWRKAHPGHLDIPYAPQARTRWDLFPADDPHAPCFVFIHGGWWQFGAREENSIVAAGFAPHGWSVALPGYTLTPDASLAQIAAEIHAALDWLQAHGASHGIGGPVLLGGWSAGALLLHSRSRSSPRPRRSRLLGRLRTRAAPRHLSRREAPPYRRRDRDIVAASPAARRQTAVACRR